jgi:uncharacterized RDD family membrane protein YckC
MSKKILKIAPNGKRFLAGLIDAVIPGFVVSGLCLTFGRLLDLFNYNEYSYNYYSYNHDVYCYQTTLLPLCVVSILVLVGIFIAYIIVQIFFYSKAQSIGKAIMKLKVVKADTGKPMTFWWMVFREFIVKEASEVFMLGYIWILIDKRHRAWHDLILDTYVVDISEVKAAPTRVNAETPKCEELQVAPEKTEAVPTEVDPVEALDETSVEVVESESDNADK